MGFSEDMLALGKTRDWEACHRRIDEEEPGETREARASIAHWRSFVLERQGRYQDALRVTDAGKLDVFSQCGYCFRRAQILRCMGKTGDAIETLRQAPFGSEIDSFPGLTYEAIFLYCYLLKQAGRDLPSNLVEALPDDFGTRYYGGRLTKADLLPPKPGSAAPA